MSTENVIQRPEFFPSSQDTAAWFAGVLEVGATAGISVTEYNDHGTFRLKTQPHLEIRTSHHPLVARLHSIYGGMDKPRFWNKGGRVAAEIVAETLPFTVGRRDHALAMQNWLNAVDIEEQINIARALEGRGWQHRGNPEDYADLVNNPAFVAGVLDGRGSMYTRPARYYHTLAIQTPSKNRALLIAMDTRFNGSSRVHNSAGTEVNRESVAFVTKEDGYVWDVIGNNAIELVRFAFPFLLTTPPEGWDYQRARERARKNHLLALKVATRARREMRLVNEHRLGRVSILPDLAERFGINKSRISRYLKETLNFDELERRQLMIQQAAGRNLDSIQIGEIVTFIEDEVRTIQETGQGRLSLIDDLAKRFGVQIRDIKGHVVPHIDPDLQAARVRIFRSQHAQDLNKARWHRDN